VSTFDFASECNDILRAIASRSYQTTLALVRETREASKAAVKRLRDAVAEAEAEADSKVPPELLETAKRLLGEMTTKGL
jgi:hypothetical protein